MDAFMADKGTRVICGETGFPSSCSDEEKEEEEVASGSALEGCDGEEVDA